MMIDSKVKLDMGMVAITIDTLIEVRRWG